MSEDYTHDELLDYAREILINRQQRGESIDAESIIAQMVNELLDEPVEAITKAVNEFFAP